MSLRTPRPWLMLAVGVLAQSSASVVQATPAFLIPLFNVERELPLADAALLAATPSVGVFFTLVLWGAATDRWGERGVLVTGLALTSLGNVGAIFAESYVSLGISFLVAGMGSGCANSASGRVVIGWFPAERRGFAMGIRQASQPLGVAIAAIAVPALAASGSFVPAVSFGAILTGATALVCAVVIVNPPRPVRATDAAGRPANPYRGDGTLARIHLASALLVVPQTVLATFGLVWLIADQGWGATAAGALVAASQFLGAIGRIGAGYLSDHVGSRLRPLRWVAIAGVPLLLLTAGTGELHLGPPVAIAYVLASCVAVADNGLAFTSIAEIAGAHWSGRALGTQNTGQALATAMVTPFVGLLIASLGYSAAFALIALAPAIAVPLIPREAAK